MTPLSEPDRRRAEFAGGTPVVMPDGRPWRLIEPAAVVRPVKGGEDGDGLMIAWDFGPGLDAETDDALGRAFQRAVAKIDRAGNDRDRACGVLEAAWLLLARNYDLSPEEFEDLVLTGGDTPAKRRMFKLINRHVEGVIRKVEALIAGMAAQAEGEAP
jgi:hypothetical protein